MKVFAKTTIFDRILEDISRLECQNRTADYVVVSEEEYVELRNDTSYRCGYSSYAGVTSPAGARVKYRARDFDLVDHGAAPNHVFRALTRGSINGVDVFVVPKAYLPR